MTRIDLLPNGLRVATLAMPGARTAALALHAETGSRHETAEQNGLAHLFEHMVFKGAGGRSAREISEAIEDVGGDLNASTDRDTTIFSASALPEHVGLGVELIADMIGRPHFDPVELEREREVVLQELAEARDTPSDIIFDELQAAAFADQPLGRSVLGDETSLAGIDVDQLHFWRERHYRAPNLFLVAAGKVEHDRILDLAGTWLGGLSGGGSVAAPEPGRFTGGRRVVRSRADQAHLALGFDGPALLDPGAQAARLFADIVGGGASSRLFQQLREERGLAYSVWASFQPWRDCGLTSVYAATSRAQSGSAAALVEEVLAEAAATASERELARVKTQARAAILMCLESPWGQANYLARQLATYGRPVDPAETLARIDAVTLDEVREAGRRMLAGPRAQATIGFAAARAA